MALLTTLRSWADRFSFAKRPDEQMLTPQAVGFLVDLLWQLDEPDEILKKAGKTRVELRKVAADDEVATALDTRRTALLATPWRLEPAEGAANEFVWQQLQRHALTIMDQAFDALLYGYNVTEVTWQVVDGKTVPAQIDKRPFEWFTPGRDGVLRMHIDGGLWSSSQSIGTPVDKVNKFILTTNRAEYRNPRGEALLSRCYWPWFLRSAGWRMWARFLERNAAPLLVGKSRDTVAMANALAAAVQSAVAAVGIDDQVSAVGTGQGGESYKMFCQEVDARIQKGILGQTLTTTVNGGGSFAAAKVHELVRQDRRMADTLMVTPAVQWFVDALMRWNFPGQPVPVFVLADERGLEMQRAERDAKLAATGQIEFDESYWLNRYDFEPGEIRARAPTAPPTAGPGVRASTDTFAPRTMPSARDHQDALDALADNAIDEAGPLPIAPAAIAEAIRMADGPDDLQRRLERLGAELPRAEFAELVGRAMFAAGVMGYVHDYEHGSRRTVADSERVAP